MFSFGSLVTRRASWSPLLVAVSLTVLGYASAARAQSVFTPLGDLPGGAINSAAYSVSGNGAVVVGQGKSASGDEAFRWSGPGTLTGLGDIAGGAFGSAARAVSPDGAVVVGDATGASGPQAFRWNAGGGMFGLGDLPGGPFDSAARGVSGSGSVVVGISQSANGTEAFRWTPSGGMVGLGSLPNGSFYSEAQAVSSDGLTVAGSSFGANGLEAYYWTPAAGMVGIGDLPGGAFNSAAYGVSPEGLAVVGVSSSALGYEAFRWDALYGMTALGDLPGGSFSSIAYAASAGGAIVVGGSEGAGGLGEAFFWTSSTGMVSLKKYLLENYAAGLPANFAAWRLSNANAISADGTVIAGEGIDPSGNPQAWQVRLPKWTPVDIAVNRTDNTSRLLWRKNDGAQALWKLAANGAQMVGKPINQVPGYTCEQIAVAPNGQTTLLWKSTSGYSTCLWTYAADLSTIIGSKIYRSPFGYTPQNIAADTNNNIRMTLRRSNGEVVFWTIAPTAPAPGAPYGAIIGYSGAYGAYADLDDGPIAVGADGQIRLLWNDIATHQAYVWTLPSVYGARTSGFVYAPPTPDAVATDIAVGADNKTLLQWTTPSGAITLWKLNTAAGGNGAKASTAAYGPIAGVNPRGVSVGGDNRARQLWRYNTGKAALWYLSDPLATVPEYNLYGPIP